MRILLLVLCLQAFFACAEEESSALGYADSLSGELTSPAQALPKGQAAQVPGGVRPYLQIPQDSLYGHTLVLPLPGEPNAPYQIRNGRIESIQPSQPSLPSNKKRPQTNKPAPIPPVVY